MHKYITLLLVLFFSLFLTAAPRKPRSTRDNAKPPISVTNEEIEADEADNATLHDSEGDEESSLDDLDDVEGGVPGWIQTTFNGDTLFVGCDKEALPRHIVVVTNNGNCTYKLLPAFIADTIKGHPADSIYNFVWTDARVNPYRVPIDSIPDSIRIDMSGFVMPHYGYITSHFGMRRYRYHYGTDIKVLVGDSIRTCWDGQVRIVGWDPRGYGYFVVMRHPNGLETVYGHFSQPLVDVGERLKAGDVIGLGGNTGRSTGSHLHFEMRYLGNAFNSEKVIDYEQKCLINPHEYLLTHKGTFSHSVSKKNPKPAGGAVQYHKIRKGDNLGRIAKKYHTTVRALCKLNNISEHTIIREGKTLRVR